MAVVINEFELVSEPQPAPRKGAPDTPGEAAPPEKLEPCAVAVAMRSLETQTLRVWAH
jgi:hypothetical protein